MSLERFVIAAQPLGRFSVEGCGQAAQFGRLSEAVAFARRSCGAAPATIEIAVGGLFAVVHEPAGWPHPICGG